MMRTGRFRRIVIRAMNPDDDNTSKRFGSYITFIAV